jgi:hypothetical protein
MHQLAGQALRRIHSRLNHGHAIAEFAQRDRYAGARDSPTGYDDIELVTDRHGQRPCPSAIRA